MDCGLFDEAIKNEAKEYLEKLNYGGNPRKKDGEYIEKEQLEKYFMKATELIKKRAIIMKKEIKEILRKYNFLLENF